MGYCSYNKICIEVLTLALLCDNLTEGSVGFVADSQGKAAHDRRFPTRWKKEAALPRLAHGAPCGEAAAKGVSL